MANMNFVCGETQFEISATEFCKQFALVIDQSKKPKDQIAVKFLRNYRGFDEGEEFCLDTIERKSVLDSLEIEVKIPVKKNNNQSGSIVIGGNVQGSNLVVGNDNLCIHTLADGNKLVTVISGNGIKVSNKTL